MVDSRVNTWISQGKENRIVGLLEWEQEESGEEWEEHVERELGETT